jgi:hypothetical protein
MPDEDNVRLMQSHVLPGGNKLSVHKGAVRAVQIFDEEFVLHLLDHRVMAGSQYVLQLDGVVRVSAHRDAANDGDAFSLKDDEHGARLRHFGEAMAHHAIRVDRLVEIFVPLRQLGVLLRRSQARARGLHQQL